MKYFLIQEDDIVLSFGQVEEDQVVTSSHPNLEYFDNIEDFEKALSLFNIELKEEKDDLPEPSLGAQENL